MDKCPYCGAETRPGDNFCLNCGNRLFPTASSPQQALLDDATIPAQDWSAPSAPTPISGGWYPASDQTLANTALSSELPTLRADASALAVQPTATKIENLAHLVIHGPNGDILQDYLLEKPDVMIGRVPECDINFPDDMLVSRKHATIHYENGHYMLHDQGSANGTLVNNQPLVSMTNWTLQDGDTILIGDHELTFKAFTPISPGIEVSETVMMPFGSPIDDAPQVDDDKTVIANDPLGIKTMDVANLPSLSPTPTPESSAPGSEVAAQAVPAPVAIPAPLSSTPSAPETISPSTIAASADFDTLLKLLWIGVDTKAPIPGEDTRSQDTTKVLSLFAIARTTLEQDDRAFVGKVYSVEAGISQSKPEGFEGEPFKLPLRSNIRFLFLDILLHTSSNIELISHWQRRLRYDSYNPEPQLVAFKFKVVTPGSCSLAIDFYYERRWLKTIRFVFDSIEQSQLTAISSEE